MSIRSFYLPLLLAASTSLAQAQNEIGFIEKFALAADREQVLTELIPGSEDYYFYHALQDQNTGQKEKYKTVMEQWAARFPNSARRRILENREALLTYQTDPKATIAFLTERLHLQFNHQQEAPDQKPNLPDGLDPARISREVFQAAALNDSREDLGRFGEAALEHLVASKTKLDIAQRRVVLSRLQRPDVPGLLDLIAAELGSKESRSFGEYPIHTLLLPEQLDGLARRLPALLENQAFVTARLQKLLPGADTDIEFDPAEHEAWLDRVWAYAKNLSPSFNSLKAHILFQRLEFDRLRGIYDKARLLEYLKLPRNTPYMSPAYLRGKASSGPSVDFNADYSTALISPPIRSDEWLLRDCLLHVLKDEESWEPYAVYLRDTYVKPIFAEAKIINGVGDPERWASLLNPQAFQELKERVDLELSTTNPQTFAPNDDVALSIAVKNSPKLVVRIYEINTLTFFLTQNRQLNTDLNLDGLVSNSERTQAFEDEAARSPFRRTVRTFQFPELSKKRGAWIVEFIGGGKSSRALVRKGQWDVLASTGPAGQMLTVVDEKHRPVEDAVVWLEGRRFTPDEKTKRIVVPFTNQAGEKPIVLASPAGDFACLTSFEHRGENYRLDAQFQIDREQLLAGRQATLAIRTAIILDDAQIPPDLLEIEQPKLTIVSKTIDDISTTREFTAEDGLKFDAKRIATQSFTVPERVVELTATLTGTVDNLAAGGEKKVLSASRIWHLNGIDKTASVYDGHLAKVGDHYVFELLGKDGEAWANQQVVFEFHHRDFNNTLTIPLRTDDHGRIALGPLGGIASVSANPGANLARTWPLEADAALRPNEIHGQTGDPLLVPWFGEDAPLRREEVSLFEQRGGTIVAEHFDALSLGNGYLQIKGLAAGDYQLFLRDGAERASLTVKVTAGSAVGSWLLSDVRNLQVRDPAPLQIEGVETTPGGIAIQLRNANAFTRVHVVADRFVPEAAWRLSSGLSSFERFNPASGASARRPNLFVSGRAIGDEYRYILDRRYSKIYPGNMLTRPGLLLNPWEVRETNQAGQNVREAENLRRARGDRNAAAPAAGAIASPAPPTQGETESNLDFLANAASALYNLQPDKDGVVRVDRQALGDRQFIQVYAENLQDAVWRSVALPESDAKFRDLRLARNLDPQKAFTQSKEVSVLAAGQTLTIADVLSADLESYDSLSSVYGLFTTLSSDPTLAKFAFVLQWPRLKDEEKRAKYSEFACHELNFFLSKKDPAFFQQVVLPYLRNKKDKTFMDDYLLGNDLHRYLEPWRYAQLNVAECALLAQRLPGESKLTARHLHELWDLLPPNPDREDHLFDTALRGRAFFGGGTSGALSGLPAETFAFKAEKEKLAEQISELKQRSSSTSAPALGAPAPLQEREVARRVDAFADSEGFREAAAKYKVAGKAADSGGAGQEAVSEQHAYSSADDFAIETMDKDEVGRLRHDVRQFFRGLGPTKEWAENNYYHLPIANQNAALIPINAFWRDYADWDGKSPFLSTHLAEAGRNFSEMMLALSVLDFPFDAPKPQTHSENGQFTLTAGGPLLAFHEEIVPTVPAAGATELLVSEGFFRADDRYRTEGNERFDKPVTEEFLFGVVYGANVVVTNPTSAPQKIELLIQIPQGSLPVQGSKATDSKRLALDPYTTQRLEYYFYFPAPSAAPFAHYQAHVSQNGQALGAAKPFAFKVVRQLSKVDTTSWDYVSQYGQETEVFAFLEQANLHQIDLTRVAWRARGSADFFHKLVALLTQRHVYDDLIYSYAIYHNDAAILREWLRHHDELLAECGPYLDSPLVTIDPVERLAYQHLEYSPLVNQRAHRLGAENQIANPIFRGQYQALLAILAHKPKLDAGDEMSVVYYLFLQDRVEEALARFDGITPNALPTRLQYDYFHCYADFYQEQLADARGIASQYASHPVDRWRKLFGDVLSQLDEIEGKGAAAPAGPASPKPDREAQLGNLASTEPSYDFKIEGGHITLTWKNLPEVTINYYLMDPELLFSSSPFVSQDSSRFSIIKPSKTVLQTLPADRAALDIPLPQEFERANVLVEILGAGQRIAQAHHANTLALTVVENYGRLELRDSVASKPVSKAYVKVYARLKSGQIRFYKDGYTDLRGKFDYASLNSGDESGGPQPRPQATGAPSAGFDYQMLRSAELGEIDRLAILVLSDAHGTTVREVSPPAE